MMTMKKNKLLRIFIFAFFIAIICTYFRSPAYAADMEFECDSSECTLDASSESKTFFNGERIVPGDSITRTLKVRNNLDSACNIYVDTKNESYSPSSFVNSLYTAIESGSTSVYGKMTSSTDASSNRDLGDLFSADSVILGTLSAKSSKEFDWTVTFANTTGDNIYQGKKVSFDVDIIMECSDASEEEIEYEYYEVEVYVDENGNEINPDDYIQEEQTVTASVGDLLGISDSGDDSGDSSENGRKPPTEAFLEALLNKLKAKAATVDEESDKVCVGSKSWFWFFVAQGFIHLILTLVLRKNTQFSDKLFYGLMSANFIAFVIIFLGVFCP